VVLVDQYEPYAALPPHHGITKTLDAAKQGFKTRYEENEAVGS
jgi:hypothetical protein